MALDDSIHGNLSEGNAQVYWGELSSHISCHHQPLQLFLKLTHGSKS